MIPAPDTPTTSLLTSHSRADDRPPPPADSAAELRASLPAATQLSPVRADRGVRSAPCRSCTHDLLATARTGAKRGPDPARIPARTTRAPRPPRYRSGTPAQVPVRDLFVSDVVVQVELPRVGAQAHLVDLPQALELEPRLDQVVGENAAG